MNAIRITLQKHIIFGMVVIPAVMVMYVDGSSAFAKSSTTTMRGVLQQQINGIKYPLKYTQVALDNYPKPATHRQSYTDGNGMFAFVVPPGNYVLTFANPKTRAAMKYVLVAKSGLYTDIAPIVLQ